jgi:hypothetical protein
MNPNSSRRRPALLVLLAFLVAGAAYAVPSPAPASAVPVDSPPVAAPASNATAPNLSEEPLRIANLLDAATRKPASCRVGLNHTLRVVLNHAPTFAADRYALLLNGNEVKGLASATDGTEGSPGQAAAYWLDFKLQRIKGNEDLWTGLLGSPTDLTVPVLVSLRETPPACMSGQPSCNSAPITIRGDAGAVKFNFVIFSPARLAGAFGAIFAVIVVVWGHARTRATLRDNLLPQLKPSSQPYSLGRWQMTFWFTLIFSAFVFLFVLLGDYNTLTAQSLALMGISGATALASVAVDVAKDSPADAANRGLKALGLMSYADVERVRQEIKDREDKLAATPTPAQRAVWQGEIQDRNNILRLYRDKSQPFVTQGWFKDITTDLNGTAVHRVQVVCWTVLLGAVFVIGVYNNLAMPQFSATVLALMGISGAGYVGFKYPEANN